MRYVRTAGMGVLTGLIALLAVFPTWAGPVPSDGVPPKLQAAILKKIVGFDQQLQGVATIRVAVAYDASSKAVADELATALQGAGFAAATVEASNLAAEAGNHHVVVSAPGVAGVGDITKGLGVLSVSSDASVVESGGASIGIVLEGGKPKILVHMGQLQAEGHKLSADVLKLARVIQ